MILLAFCRGSLVINFYVISFVHVPVSMPCQLFGISPNGASQLVCIALLSFITWCKVHLVFVNSWMVLYNTTVILAWSRFPSVGCFELPPLRPIKSQTLFCYHLLSCVVTCLLFWNLNPAFFLTIFHHASCCQFDLLSPSFWCPHQRGH